MRILVALTYYRPHTSGLTVYAERLARGLAARGHAVTVLTSGYDSSLPPFERRDGVDVVRVPVAFRVSKGVIMPRFGRIATALARVNDAFSLHLPQLDASGLALRGRRAGKPVVLTYHCDLTLPPGPFSSVVDRVVAASNHLAARWSDAVVAYTEDYAAHSPLLRRQGPRLRVVPPPVEVETPSPGAVEAFRERFNPDNAPVVGMAARLASEKGAEILLEALGHLRRDLPGVRVLFAGQHDDVLGERAYRDRLRPALQRQGDRWRFLGVLDPSEMAVFFRSIDVLTVPSLNSTESFGLVQVEAMLSGTPSVASDLPGVRQPVRVTGMGEIAPVGDPVALAAALLKVLKERPRYVRPRAEIEARYGTARTIDAYEALFAELGPIAAARRNA